MPSLRVMKNGTHLCTVGSADVWMFSAGVWSDIWGPEASHLDVHGGGKHREGEESEFLVWETLEELNRTDRVEFFFDEDSASLPPGRVFDPADDPPEEPKVEISSPPTDDDLAKLALRPALNDGVSWTFSLNGAAELALAPDPSRQFMSLSLLWNDRQPERLRVSLSKKSLREIRDRTDGETILSDYVPTGSSIRITVS